MFNINWPTKYLIFSGIWCFPTFLPFVFLILMVCCTFSSNFFCLLTFIWCRWNFSMINYRFSAFDPIFMGKSFSFFAIIVIIWKIKIFLLIFCWNFQWFSFEFVKLFEFFVWWFLRFSCPFLLKILSLSTIFRNLNKKSVRF